MKPVGRHANVLRGPTVGVDAQHAKTAADVSMALAASPTTAAFQQRLDNHALTSRALTSAVHC